MATQMQFNRRSGNDRSATIAAAIKREVRAIDGVVDCRIMQRLDYPQYVINIDRTKSMDLVLTQVDVMKNIVSSVNNSIQFNKKNFWIDPVSHNQYYVGVQYREEQIQSIDTILDVPITSDAQKRPIPLRNVATVEMAKVPAEITHATLQPTIDLTMGVHGRDLGHVAHSDGQTRGSVLDNNLPQFLRSPHLRAYESED